MKISLLYIYWFLLSVSFTSSCLLFILVASEGIKLSSENSQLKNDTEINNLEGGIVEKFTSEAEVEATDLKTSFEEISADSDNSRAHAEFIVAQNSGLSDPGQAVVFTLVDTATAELHERADNLPGTRGSHVTTHVLPAEANSTLLNPQTGTTYTPTILAQTGIDINAKQSEEIHNQKSSTEKIDQDIAPSNNSDSVPLKTIPQQSESNYIVRAEPKVISQEKEAIQTPSVDNTTLKSKNDTTQDTQKESVKAAEPEKEVQEDIPSFSEWTQKQLQEAEKREKVNTSSQNSNSNKNTSSLKLRSKNYASPDCGAKIVASNPEAISASSVLTHSRDEYKLNACTTRIWFIVELCEAIQAKKIDLANFELFSSSPKDFTVSVSDRYPSRDWSNVGHFQAKDERDVQSFNLHPHLFGKFIKVEMLSHWGSEHFCPISLFRVYGTSEFEVLETEDLPETDEDDDDEDDEPLDKGEPTNLFGSARDAVMSIVKKAAEVLVKSGDSSNQTVLNQYKKYSPLINACSTPSHIVVCDNCSDILFAKVYELLSCKSDHLHNVVNISMVKKSLYNTDICNQYGLNFFSKTTDKQTTSQSGYVMNFFAPKYIAALCNVLAVLENKVVLNVSNQYTNNTTNIENHTFVADPFEINKIIIENNKDSCANDELHEINTCAIDQDTKPTVIIENNISDVSTELEISPTKTFSSQKNYLDSNFVEQTEDIPIITTAHNTNINPTETIPLPIVEKGNVKNASDEDINSENGTLDAEKFETFEIVHDQLDNFLSELNLDADGNAITTSAPANSVPQQVQKESVFLRLSNRIKALERNMSLSGQYLEELSRRYKKQVEEMQRAFEKKLSFVSDENKRRDEEVQQLHEKLKKLTSNLESLLTERDSSWKTVTFLVEFLLFELLIACILLYFCWRTPEGSVDNQRNKSKKNIQKQFKRRKSIDTIGHESPTIKKKRRPSEEALKITGTYKHLLIADEVDNAVGILSKAEKRRRRKKNALLRSQSVVASQIKSSLEAKRRSNSSEMKESDSVFLNGDLEPPVTIEEIPFVLEESEHSSIEPVDFFTDKKSDATIVPNKIKNGSIKQNILKSHSPLFMKTALSSRSKRTKRLNLFKTEKNVFSSREPSVKNTDNNSVSVSDSQDDQTSLNSDNSKKRLGGLKRMFKKVF